jgi:nucleoside-diphosphate-sugar epimerase
MTALATQWGVEAQRVRSLVASGRLGSIVRFDARLCAPALAAAAAPDNADGAKVGQGVLADPGVRVFALLSSWLGPLTPVALVDDGAGGIEAEAIARVATVDGVPGTVVLSRLRPLPNSIVVTGTQGRVEFDLERSLLTAEPSALLERIDAGANVRATNVEGHATELIAGLRAMRQRLVHAWEGAVPNASETDKDSTRIAGRRVLVTGGTGFIGARLVEVLVELGARITLAVRNHRHTARVARFDVELVAADLRSGELDDVVGGHDIVFSLAYDFHRSGAANVALHRNLADACARRGVRRFVHLSSIAVYDDWPSGRLDERSPSDAPGSEYKAAKRAMEVDLARRAAEGALSAAILQPTIVYGPFGAFWTDRFAARLLAGTIEVPRSGLGTCSGVYVDDVVAASIKAAVRDGAGNGPWIISGAQPFDWVALIGGYADALGRKLAYGVAADEAAQKARPRVDPLAIAQWPPARDVLAFLRERVGDERIDRLRERVVALSARRGPAVYRPADDDPSLYLSQGACDITRARRELGFAPAFDLDSGLRRTSDYIRWRYRK